MGRRKLCVVRLLWGAAGVQLCKWSNLGALCSCIGSPSCNAAGPAGAVEGAMCPSLGGTRKDVIWGHYHLMDCHGQLQVVCP